MALTNLPGYPTKIQSWAVQILPADTTVVKTVVTAGANGSIIESINVSSTDVLNSINIQVNDGTTSHQLAIISLPATAGNLTGTAAVDILRNGNIPGLPVDSNGNFVLYLPNGWTLKVGAGTTITAAKVIDVVCMGADY